MCVVNLKKSSILKGAILSTTKKMMPVMMRQVNNTCIIVKSC